MASAAITLVVPMETGPCQQHQARPRVDCPLQKIRLTDYATAERAGVHHLLAALSGRVPRHEAARADDDRGTKIHAWRPRPCVITRPSALDGGQQTSPL